MQLVTPDLGLFFWAFVSFTGAFFILRKYAFGPIVESLTTRETFITNALQSAEKAREEMLSLQAGNQKLLDEARAERDVVLKKANEAAENLINEAKNKAIAEGNKMIEDARTAIRQEQQAAVEGIRKQVAELSVEIAEKILRNQLKDQSSQKDFVNEILKQSNLN
ncbi:MAG: F0F1 ATP synthase subunit B [Verrucomicrobia bacterium]|nr:F0F1 ATP synthase subunit B [Cytophagales bacterium]